MASPAQKARAHLEQVAILRAARDADADLARRVVAVKQYQHARFARDYANLLAQERYRAATQFFLEDLYGPADFADRDTQFGRVVPAMARVFPSEVMHTVAQLAELHALTEGLDQEMAQATRWQTLWMTDPIVPLGSAVGRRDARQRQLEILIAIGTSLDQHTRTALLKTTLRLMRAPAKAAGLGQLQSFLERGLAAFVRHARCAAVSGDDQIQRARTIDDLFAGHKAKNPTMVSGRVSRLIA